MEISVYNVHHIIAKFLSLRRVAYNVSDVLVFLCSFLCCQCFEYIQDMHDGFSEASSVAYQIVPRLPRKVDIDARSFEDLFDTGSLEINFEKPKSNWTDRPCSKLSTTETRKLDGKMAQDNNFEQILTKLTGSPNIDKDISSAVHIRKDEYPLVHSHRRVPDQHEMVAISKKSENM